MSRRNDFIWSMKTSSDNYFTAFREFGITGLQAFFVTFSIPLMSLLLHRVSKPHIAVDTKTRAMGATASSLIAARFALKAAAKRSLKHTLEKRMQFETEFLSNLEQMIHICDVKQRNQVAVAKRYYNTYFTDLFPAPNLHMSNLDFNEVIKKMNKAADTLRPHCFDIVQQLQRGSGS